VNIYVDDPSASVSTSGGSGWYFKKSVRAGSSGSYSGTTPARSATIKITVKAE
jgi:hypothetical protein